MIIYLATVRILYNGHPERVIFTTPAAARYLARHVLAPHKKYRCGRKMKYSIEIIRGVPARLGKE